jgi:hypothetical protein
MGVIIGCSMESYTYEECKSDQYSSLWKIHEATIYCRPAKRSRRLIKFVVMITRALTCAPDLPLEFQDKGAYIIIDLLQGQPIQHADHASSQCRYLLARLQFKRILPVRVPGRSDL